MYIKSRTDLDFEKLIKKEEDKLKRSFQNNYKTQQATLDLLKKSIDHCKFNNFNDNKSIWNLASYINIISYDLKIIGENLILNKDEWGKRFFARQSALLIYEAIEDILELSGKKFRIILDTFSNSVQLKDELNKCIKLINLYKQDNIEYLKLIRHNCAAHRDHDCIEQLKVITSINWSDSISYLTKFDSILMGFGAFIQKVIDVSVEESLELKKAKR